MLLNSQYNVVETLYPCNKKRGSVLKDVASFLA
jgi:hypothetical protein